MLQCHWVCREHGGHWYWCQWWISILVCTFGGHHYINKLIHAFSHISPRIVPSTHISALNSTTTCYALATVRLICGDLGLIYESQGTIRGLICEKACNNMYINVIIIYINAYFPLELQNPYNHLLMYLSSFSSSAFCGSMPEHSAAFR